MRYKKTGKVYIDPAISNLHHFIWHQLFVQKTAKNGSLQNKVTEIQLPHITICKIRKENEKAVPTFA